MQPSLTVALRRTWAWRSENGFQSGSKITTTEAAVRFKPTPPAPRHKRHKLRTTNIDQWQMSFSSKVDHRFRFWQESFLRSQKLRSCSKSMEHMFERLAGERQLYNFKKQVALPVGKTRLQGLKQILATRAHFPHRQAGEALGRQPHESSSHAPYLS